MRLNAVAPLILALIVVTPAAAQTPIAATTESGQTVLLYPDGTWKYKVELSASTPGSKGYVWAPSATVPRVLLSGQEVGMARLASTAIWFSGLS